MSSRNDHRFMSLFKRFIPFSNPAKSSNGRDDDQQLSAATVSVLLPDSVMLQILLKLPVKSIIQCKCVCKSWYRLILDPYFTKTYSNNPPFTAMLAVIFCASKLTQTFNFLEMGTRNGISDVMLTQFDLKALNMPKTRKSGNTRAVHTAIVGSRNGLICLVETPSHCVITQDSHSYGFSTHFTYNKQTVYLINPMIGKCVVMPKVDTDAEENDNVIYGFGSAVDGEKENYKVVRIVIKDYEFVGKVLTSGVDKKWRKFGNSSFPISLHTLPGYATSLNGILHWAGRDSQHIGLIYAFDLQKEIGNCIKLPHGLEEPNLVQTVLAVWNGNLCFTDGRFNKLQVDIWTMKQYGVADSWTRDIVLSSSIPNMYPIIPVTTRRNGDLLLVHQHSQSLFSFDPNTKNCVEIEGCDKEYVLSNVFEYIPSFFAVGHRISKQK